jgi:D-aminopeptidase
MNLRVLLPLFVVCVTGFAQTAPRARALGVPFDGTPGPLDAITDVKAVEVGDTTLIHGEGKLVEGQGPVRTGVTVVFPRGRADADPVYAGWFSQNGNGEMTGTTWVEESGFLEGPIGITNTHSVGLVRDSIIAWSVKSGRLAQQPWSLPVVAETWDGYLNDINGFHIQQADVFSALDTAKAGPVPEGNVGGGTGMVCYGFKGGDGTASRVLSADAGGYTVGVLVQCNCGRRPQLTIAGVPVGKLIPATPAKAMLEPEVRGDVGSIIIVVATDAPLLPGQLKRLARRATMGLAPAPAQEIPPAISSSPFPLPTVGPAKNLVPTLCSPFRTNGSALCSRLLSKRLRKPLSTPWLALKP